MNKVKELRIDNTLWATPAPTRRVYHFSLLICYPSSFNLPLNTIIEFCSLVINISCVIEKDNEYFPEIYLDECLYVKDNPCPTTTLFSKKYKYNICTRNAMPTVLLLQMMGGWDRWGWLIYIRVWVGGHGVVSSYICFLFFYLVLLYFVVSRLLSLFIQLTFKYDN